jgi:serine protease Do
MFPFFQVPPGQQQGPPPTQEGTGSGFLISADGLIMTNNHVVEDATQINVEFQDRRLLPARVIGRDPTTDVAIIKVEGNGFPAVRLGRSDQTRVGEWVLAIGNPLNIGTTLTAGIVSAKGRPLGIIGQNYAVEDFIQTDAAINRGNSGGPLVNLRGEVIGMNTAIFSPTGVSAGYGFAVPIDLARRVSDDLVRYGRIRRPRLGVIVNPIDAEGVEVFRLPSPTGAVVAGFATDDSPAQRAGLRAGDVIMAVNGQAVESSGRLSRVLANFQPGETVTLEVIRYGARQQFRVRLGEVPSTPAGPTATAAAATPRPAPPAAVGKLGVQYAPITPQLAQQMRLNTREGLVITNVQAGGPAARKGVQRGQRIVEVDRQPIRTAEQFDRIMAGKRPGEIVSMLLADDREGRQIFANVRLP